MILDIYSDDPEIVKGLDSLNYSLIFIVLALSRIVIFLSIYSSNQIGNKSEQPITQG